MAKRVEEKKVYVSEAINKETSIRKLEERLQAKDVRKQERRLLKRKIERLKEADRVALALIEKLPEQPAGE